MKKRLPIQLVCLFFVFCITPLSADEDGADKSSSASGYPEWPRWYLTAGMTWLDADGRYGLYSPEFGSIPILDFGTVGLEDRDTSHYISLAWRSSESRWGAWFANWRFDALGSRAWSKNVPINPDFNIPVGASVTSEFDADFYIVEVSYSFFRNEQIDAGIGFGFHAVNLETNLSAKVNVGDFEEEVIYGEINSLAPLPNVTGYASWRFLPRWTLSGRLGWFGLSVDKFSGDMINAHALLDFHLSKRWVLGGGYQFVSLDVDIDELDDKGYKEIYDLDFDGPVLYISLTF